MPYWCRFVWLSGCSSRIMQSIVFMRESSPFSQEFTPVGDVEFCLWIGPHFGTRFANHSLLGPTDSFHKTNTRTRSSLRYVSYLTTVLLKIQVFWDVRPCRLLNNYQWSVMVYLIRKTKATQFSEPSVITHHSTWPNVRKREYSNRLLLQHRYWLNSLKKDSFFVCYDFNVYVF